MFKNLSHFNSLILFRMGIFGAAQGWGSKKSPLPKICSTYPKMMKLGTVIPYLKKIQKIYESRGTPPEFCWHQYFSPEISKCYYIKNYRYRLHLDTFLFLLTFLESLKICFNKNGYSFDVVSKSGYPRPS